MRALVVFCVQDGWGFRHERFVEKDSGWILWLAFGNAVADEANIPRTKNKTHLAMFMYANIPKTTMLDDNRKYCKFVLKCTKKNPRIRLSLLHTNHFCDNIEALTQRQLTLYNHICIHKHC